MAQKLIYNYDDEGDVLYIFLGKPYGTLNLDVDGDVTVRFDPETQEAVGFTVLDCSLTHPELLKPEGQRDKVFAFFLSLIRKSNAALRRYEAEQASTRNGKAAAKKQPRKTKVLAA